MTQAKTDARYMALALSLARRGLGRVWPNPSVGCVIVNNGVIVGRGRTADGGRPHAETEALKQAETAARGATAYVTLEPCCHHGHTPPCAEALIAAGIHRVVVACVDHDPRVSGGGLTALRKAGVDVAEGLMEAEARALNAGFFLKVREGRPHVSLKIAATLDGKMALANGQSQWITGESARRYGQWLRAGHDAIVTGAGTVRADDPQLTCRLPGLEAHSPVRVVLDTALATPPEAALVRSAPQVPVWLLCDAAAAESARATALTAAGCVVMTCATGSDGKVDVRDALKELAQHGITRVLVEAGPTLATAFLEAAVIDRLYWFQALSMIGADGMAAVQALGLEAMDQIRRFVPAEPPRRLGHDVLHILEP